MPLQPQDSPLGAFLKALREEGIACILIGAMAAIEQGAPLMRWIMISGCVCPSDSTPACWPSCNDRAEPSARALYALRDGTQVNAIFQPDGLRSFAAEWKASRWGKLDNVAVKVLPLRRVIASKRAANREKDVAVLPILKRTLRLAKRLKNRRTRIEKPVKQRKGNRSKIKLR